MKKILTAAFVLCFITLILRYPNTSAALNGLIICRDILLPSLFPFMIISSFATYCGASEIFSLIFYPITKILSLPLYIGGIWFSSFLGGFPSGASSICSLYEIGCIDKNQAEKLIPCCICSGPAFLIIAVGKVMLKSYEIGFIIFISQIISVIFLTAIFFKTKSFKHEFKADYLPLSVSLVYAVNNSALSMIYIFSYVILFSIVVDIMSKSSYFLYILSLFFEVTVGCKYLAQYSKNILLMAFLTGFGGISVCFQILSIANRNGLSPKNFWIIRFLNGFLCSAICYILLIIFPLEIPVYLSNSSQHSNAIYSINSILGSVCFSAMLLAVLQKLDVYRSKFM